MIEAKLKNIIANQFGIVEESITFDLALVSDLGADSLDLVEIVMSIEQHFGIVIENQEYATADTIGKIVSLINSKLPGA